MKEGQAVLKCGVTVLWDSKGNMSFVDTMGQMIEIPRDNIPSLQKVLYPVAKPLIGEFGI